MPIRFACECGKEITVPDEYAGRKGRCSQCGKSQRVPGEPVAGRPEALGPAPGRFCPNCRKPYQEGDVICVNCGRNLKTGESLQGSDEEAGPDERKRRLMLIGGAGLAVIIIALAALLLVGGSDEEDEEPYLRTTKRQTPAETTPTPSATPVPELPREVRRQVERLAAGLTGTRLEITENLLSLIRLGLAEDEGVGRGVIGLLVEKYEAAPPGMARLCLAGALGILDDARGAEVLIAEASAKNIRRRLVAGNLLHLVARHLLLPETDETFRMSAQQCIAYIEQSGLTGSWWDVKFPAVSNRVGDLVRALRDYPDDEGRQYLAAHFLRRLRLAELADLPLPDPAWPSLSEVQRQQAIAAIQQWYESHGTTLPDFDEEPPAPLDDEIRRLIEVFNRSGREASEARQDLLFIGEPSLPQLEEIFLAAGDDAARLLRFGDLMMEIDGIGMDEVLQRNCELIFGRNSTPAMQVRLMDMISKRPFESPPMLEALRQISALAVDPGVPARLFQGIVDLFRNREQAAQDIFIDALLTVDPTDRAARTKIETRVRIVEALGSLRARQAVANLGELLQYGEDREPEAFKLRGAAVRALALIGEGTEQYLDRVLGLLRDDPDNGVRAACISFIARVGNIAHIRQLADQLDTERNEAVANAILDAFADFGHRITEEQLSREFRAAVSEKVLARFAVVSKGQNILSLRAALQALGPGGGPEAVAVLRAELEWEPPGRVPTGGPQASLLERVKEARRRHAAAALRWQDQKEALEALIVDGLGNELPRVHSAAYNALVEMIADRDEHFPFGRSPEDKVLWQGAYRQLERDLVYDYERQQFVVRPRPGDAE